MDSNIAGVKGTIGSQLRHGLRAALRQIIGAGVLAFVIAALVVEFVGALALRGVPMAETHIVALLLALALGYAVAMSVALRELARTGVKALEFVAEEARRLGIDVMREAEQVARRVEGEADLMDHLSSSSDRWSGSVEGVADSVSIPPELAHT